MVPETAYLLTLRDWLRHAVSQFNAAGLAFGHGSDNAWDEAVYLLLHTLHLPIDRLDPFLDARLLDHERDAIARVLARRIDERIPAAYITGEAWLGSCRFVVDPRVIVPRSHIAGLLPEGLAPFLATGEPTRVLDLCTGSGCLAILAALAYPDAGVDAVDISEDALEVARRNVRDYELDDRIELFCSDLYAGLPRRRYDLILSNPPYVTAAAMASLPPEYRHEPSLALAGGEDGLDVLRRLIAAAPAFLGPDGILVVEVGHNRELAEAAFPHLPFLWLETAGATDAVFLLRRDDLPGR